jgi:hypothetical protein
MKLTNIAAIVAGACTAQVQTVESLPPIKLFQDGSTGALFGNWVTNVLWALA